MEKLEEPVIIVGVDWATEHHDVCIMLPNGEVKEEFQIEHSADGLTELLTKLVGYSPGRESLVHVGIEVPHGVVVETLMERGVAVFSINPKQLDRFRDRFSMAGCKDDRLDARVLASSLRTDAPCFRRLRAIPETIVRLREWSRILDDLKDDRVRLSNRLREQLRRYYPQFLEVHQDLSASWLLDLWELAPTPADGARIALPAVETLLKERRIRKVTGSRVLAILGQRAVTVAPGTVEAAQAHIQVLIAQLRVVQTQVRLAEGQLDTILDELVAPKAEESPGQLVEQRDAAILRTLPGIGRIVLATLLAEALTVLDARDYHGLRALSGVAPVTKRSGKTRNVLMRRACNERLREATYHWARVAMQHDDLAKAAYAAIRKRGNSHGRALRTVADRLMSVAVAMLRTGTAYDPSKRRSLRDAADPERLAA